jgi:hypothetical protein
MEEVYCEENGAYYVARFVASCQGTYKDEALYYNAVRRSAHGVAK